MAGRPVHLTYYFSAQGGLPARFPELHRRLAALAAAAARAEGWRFAPLAAARDGADGAWAEPPLALRVAGAGLSRLHVRPNF